MVDTPDLGVGAAGVSAFPFSRAIFDAALIGGTASHAHDYDDQSLTGHPSAVLVPAILAEAEFLGSTGKEMITAYVAGYEVWAELVKRSANYHRKGWHPTSVFGVIGAAASASVLKHLASEKAVAALAIAGSHAGGLAANFGTMTKPYHACLAARDGLLSTRLAVVHALTVGDHFAVLIRGSKAADFRKGEKSREEITDLMAGGEHGGTRGGDRKLHGHPAR